MLSRAVQWTGVKARLLLDQCGVEGQTPPCYFLPRILGPLSRASGLEPEAVLWRHTVFPHLMAFRSFAEAHANAAFALASQASESSSPLPGVLRRFVHRLSNLRYCSDCTLEDLRIYGEAYWHREHNLPLVFYCARHATLLKVSTIPSCATWKAYSEGLPCGARGVSLRLDTSPQVAKLVSSTSLQTLDGPVAFQDFPARCRARASALGYTLPKLGIARQQLSIDLRAFYGTTFLRAIGCEICDVGWGWPGYLLGPIPSGTVATAKYILLEAFLAAGSTARPETWAYRRAGMPASSPQDERFACEFKSEARSERYLDCSSTGEAILRRIGAWSQYRHNRPAYPKLKAALVAFYDSGHAKSRNTPKRNVGPAVGLSRNRRDQLSNASSIDRHYATLLQAQVEARASASEKATARDLLLAVGFARRFYRARSRYPLVKRTVETFLSSDAASRKRSTS
ncbi:MAG: TniQ family protein [Proteobacteria bacterium]|nr:TniQ family protein [Pseudomonadota bacterium]